MTQTSNTFYNYLMRNRCDEKVLKFLDEFRNEIDNITEDLISSKQIMKAININTPNRFKIFQNVFMDYFAYKVKEEL
uniref:Uncharacterized protein n=1 Tax=viral metagenome TaxID=1070528 RepID=A0A6C0DZH5_9ZZZZ